MRARPFVQILVSLPPGLDKAMYDQVVAFLQAHPEEAAKYHQQAQSIVTRVQGLCSSL